VSRDAQSDLPGPERLAILEGLLQQTQEEQMPSEALAGLTPLYRRLMEMLFLETLPQPSTEVTERGAVGCTRQKCFRHLRWRRAELGFR
jgi:hypothetical protein